MSHINTTQLTCVPEPEILLAMPLRKFFPALCLIFFVLFSLAAHHSWVQHSLLFSQAGETINLGPQQSGALALAEAVAQGRPLPELWLVSAEITGRLTHLLPTNITFSRKIFLIYSACSSLALIPLFLILRQLAIPLGWICLLLLFYTSTPLTAATMLHNAFLALPFFLTCLWLSLRTSKFYSWLFLALAFFILSFAFSSFFDKEFLLTVLQQARFWGVAPEDPQTLGFHQKVYWQDEFHFFALPHGLLPVRFALLALPLFTILSLKSLGQTLKTRFRSSSPETKLVFYLTCILFFLSILSVLWLIYLLPLMTIALGIAITRATGWGPFQKKKIYFVTSIAMFSILIFCNLREHPLRHGFASPKIPPPLAFEWSLKQELFQKLKTLSHNANCGFAAPHLGLSAQITQFTQCTHENDRDSYESLIHTLFESEENLARYMKRWDAKYFIFPADAVSDALFSPRYLHNAPKSVPETTLLLKLQFFPHQLRYLKHIWNNALYRIYTLDPAKTIDGISYSTLFDPVFYPWNQDALTKTEGSLRSAFWCEKFYKDFETLMSHSQTLEARKLLKPLENACRAKLRAKQAFLKNETSLDYKPGVKAWQSHVQKDLSEYMKL